MNEYQGNWHSSHKLKTNGFSAITYIKITGSKSEPFLLLINLRNHYHVIYLQRIFEVDQ